MNEQTLQAPATAGDMTPEERYAAGHGGSYTVDPKTGAVTLNGCTQPGTVSNKHPDAPRATQDDAGEAEQSD